MPAHRISAEQRCSGGRTMPLQPRLGARRLRLAPSLDSVEDFRPGRRSALFADRRTHPHRHDDSTASSEPVPWRSLKSLLKVRLALLRVLFRLEMEANDHERLVI